MLAILCKLKVRLGFWKMSKTSQMSKAIAVKFKSAKEGVEKLQSKEWAESAGQVMGVTAGIVTGLGRVPGIGFVPGIGILGGALKMGSCILNPKPSLKDIKRQTEELTKLMEESSEAVKGFFEEKLEQLQKEMSKQQEVWTDMEIVKEEVESSLKTIQTEMNSIQDDITDIKDIVQMTFALALDIRFRDGIEGVDAAYEVFIQGAANVELTLKTLENYIFELQTNAIKTLSTQRIRSYLQAVFVSDGPQMCTEVMKYILVVRAKYLQMIVVYSIFQYDAERVVNEFKAFNCHYDELLQAYEEVVGEQFNTETPFAYEHEAGALPDVAQACYKTTSADEKQIQVFLQQINLLHLSDKFVKQGITMADIIELNDDELKEVGVAEFGYRRKIIKAIDMLKDEKKGRTFAFL